MKTVALFLLLVGALFAQTTYPVACKSNKRMKTYRGACLLLIASALLGGCTAFYADVAKVIPPGDYKVINATVTGKFSATQFTGENVTITPAGRMHGGHVHVRHSNLYVPLIEFDLQAADTFGLPTVPPASTPTNAPIPINTP